MAEVLEKTGKTVDEAYKAALEELGVPEEQTTCEVLEEPAKGFLGLIGSKLARVRVTVKEISPIQMAEDFLTKIFAAMQLEVKLVCAEKEDAFVINLVGEDLGILIGKHGQTLDSLQYLTNLAANRGISDNRIHVIVDVENYRSRREDTLRRLALRLADKVKHTGEKVMLEPMNRHERKIIHMALQDSRRVSTYSSGEEPYRKVVIELKHNNKE